MNYPIEALTYIAPTLFIVLMIAFPVIGVFGGWKRAVYWGGGNFLFYVIGLLIWTFAGEAIIEPLKPLITKLLEQTGTTTDLTNIVKSIVAPVFFIVVLFLSNIILVINYYAWYKRVVGLKKYKTVAKKNKDGTVTKVKVRNQVQLSTTGKVVNMVVGGVAMTALMLPTTFAFTEAVSMTTTCNRTRATNKLSSGVHNAMVATDEKVNWFSYYNGSAKDFDALFGALGMLNNQISITKSDGSTIDGTALEVMGTIMDEGIGDIFKWTTASDSELEEKYSGDKTYAVIESTNQFANNWNQLVEQCSDDMTGLFNSDKATEIVKDVIYGGEKKSPEKITPSNINNYLEGGAFDQVVNVYWDPETGTARESYHSDKADKDVPITPIQQIDVDQQCYDNIREAVLSSYEFDPSIPEEQKKAFEAKMDQLINIMFK